MADNAETKNVARLDFNIDKAEAKLNKLDQHLKTISDSSEQYAKKIGLAINNGIDYKTIAKSIGLSEKELHKLTTTAQKEAIITKEYRERQEIKTTEALKREHTKQQKSVETLYDKISKYAGTYLIYQGFNMLKRSIGEVIDEMVELESSMVQIDRVLNETSLNIDNYRDKLMQIAYDYGNSMDNVTDIALRLAQAGYDSNEVLSLTEKTLLALNTAELNATQATDDMVAVMAQWGLMTGSATEQARNYGEIIDKINKVADNFPTTSQDIMDALKKTSSAFNLAGASIDETIALITSAEVASQRGGKVIGTALSNIAQQLKDEGRLNIAESLGLNFFTDEKKTEFKGIVDIFAEMSEKMQELKNAGKENSVEMQQLLSIFTVFRRNIGASLLGQMEGEGGTYFDVLNKSLTATGYSLQENEKYLKTSKAAQEQFNVSLLDLKTKVWDNGVEDVYKSMLIFGKELVGNIGMLVDQFGGLPTIIGAVTLALSLFSKQMKVVSYDTKTGIVNTSGFIKELTNDIKKFTLNITAMPKSIKSTMDASSMSFTTLSSNLMKYGVAVDSASLKTLAFKAATIGLNLAASAAATAGMMLLTSIIQELINKEATAIELQRKSVEATEKQISKREDEISNLEQLMKLYDELAVKTERTPEETTQIYEIQVKIKDILGKQADTIDLINGKYDEQKQKIKELSLEEKRRLVDEKEKLMIQKQNEQVKIDLPSPIQAQLGNKNYSNTLWERGGVDLGDEWEFFSGGGLKGLLERSSLEEAIDLFTQWEKNLRNIYTESEELRNTYNFVNDTLGTLTATQKEANEATEDYYESLASLRLDEIFPEGSIKNAEAYKNILQELETQAENSTGNLKIYTETFATLFKERFSEFAKQIDVVNEKIKTEKEVMTELSTEVEQLQNQYSILTTAQNELNETGEITISTFKNLVDKNLLDYLEVIDGKIRVNTESLRLLAEQKKIEAIESLQAAAAEDIHKLALGEETTMSDRAKNAIANFGNQAENTGNKASTAAGKILELASALAQAVAANSELAGENNVSDFSAKANAIANAYKGAAKKIGAITLSSVGSSTRRTSGSSGTSSSSSASTAQREAEEAYKKRLEEFTKALDKMEEKEEYWVKKQRELGLLSNKDMLYVTQQRIKRYNDYLNQIRKATWMNAEDRLKLEEEYTKKIQDLDLDYFDYLKGNLDDQVKAIEDARDKKIKALEDEYDKKIELIKKERTAEKDANERQEILDDIAYWEQRTGREAVENLAEARKKLIEFDKEAEIDAKIEALEAEEEAQKASLEQQAQNEIDALQRTYDAKVKAFSEANQIIYDNSVISSQNLYNAYKENFVDPLKKDMESINKVTTSEPAKQQYETYTIKKGDTLSAIASKYGTTVDKIMQANPYIKNKNLIYTGNKLQIPKFHGGGIAGGDTEFPALLKKGEVVLKPEWSASLNRLMKYFDNITEGKSQVLNNNSTIEVNGNLVNIQANVRNQSDIDAIGQKVEKILKDKFNIKK